MQVVHNADQFCSGLAKVLEGFGSGPYSKIHQDDLPDAIEFHIDMLALFDNLQQTFGSIRVGFGEIS